MGLKFGLYFESFYVRGGESPFHPPGQKGRGPTGGLKLCESAGKHPKSPNFSKPVSYFHKTSYNSKFLLTR